MTFRGFKALKPVWAFIFLQAFKLMKNDTGTSFLWEIRTQLQTQPSYILGTMHVRDDRAYTYWNQSRIAIDQCETVALETDIAMLKQAFNSELIMLPADKKLSDYYKPQQYAKISKYFKIVTGKPIDEYERFHPMFAEGYLSAAMMEKQRPLALDEALFMYATAKGKELTGIEPFEHHIGVLEKLNPETAAPNLYKAVRNIGAFRKQLNKLADLYASGAMKRLNKSLLRQSGKMRKVMIYERNFLMANEIAKLASEKPTFCAIGAGHMSGSKGVLRLLKQLNFQLKPVPCHT